MLWCVSSPIAARRELQGYKCSMAIDGTRLQKAGIELNHKAQLKCIVLCKARFPACVSLSCVALGGIGCPSQGKCKKPLQEKLRISLYLQDIITSVCMRMYQKDCSIGVFIVLIRRRQKNKHLCRKKGEDKTWNSIKCVLLCLFSQIGVFRDNLSDGLWPVPDLLHK